MDVGLVCTVLHLSSSELSTEVCQFTPEQGFEGQVAVVARDKRRFLEEISVHSRSRLVESRSLGSSASPIMKATAQPYTQKFVYQSRFVCGPDKRCVAGGMGVHSTHKLAMEESSGQTRKSYRSETRQERRRRWRRNPGRRRPRHSSRGAAETDGRGLLQQGVPAGDPVHR